MLVAAYWDLKGYCSTYVDVNTGVMHTLPEGTTAYLVPIVLQADCFHAVCAGSVEPVIETLRFVGTWSNDLFTVVSSTISPKITKAHIVAW